MTRAGRGAASSRGVLVALVVALLGTVPLLGTPAAAQLVAPPGPVLDGHPPEGWPELPDLDAPFLLLVDGATGQVLGARDAGVRREVASTVKVLTALTVASRHEPDEVVEVGDEVIGLEGASVDLQPGDRWTVEQLLEAIIVRSGNDAAEALAAHAAGGREAFLELMRADAAALGLTTEGLVLTSPSGLGDENRLSASDLATIARAALADPDLRPLLAASEATLPGIGTAENRNLLIGSYPGATGVKTGFTELAGNSLVASARRDGRELVAVVLGAGPDPQRFVEATALLDHGFDAFDRLPQLSATRRLRVAGGLRELTSTPADVTVPVGADAQVVLPLPGHLPSTPVRAVLRVDGVELAELDAAVGGAPLAAVGGTGEVGRALVDGVYAALRATSGPSANR